MAHTPSIRLTVALAAGAVASALAAAPALATEPGAPGSGQFPSGLSPVTFAPTLTGPATRSAAKVVRRARLVPRRVQRGRRAQLRISLAAPSKLMVVMRRGAKGHRIRTFNVPAGGTSVKLRLPGRRNGHALYAGRYGISIVSIDSQGVRSQPVMRTLTVRRNGR